MGVFIRFGKVRLALAEWGRFFPVEEDLPSCGEISTSCGEIFTSCGEISTHVGRFSPRVGKFPSLFPVERGGAGRGANGKLGGAGRAEQSWLFGEDSGWGGGESSPLAHLPPLSLSFALSDKPQRMESHLPGLDFYHLYLIIVIVIIFISIINIIWYLRYTLKTLF